MAKHPTDGGTVLDAHGVPIQKGDLLYYEEPWHDPDFPPDKPLVATGEFYQGMFYHDASPLPIIGRYYTKARPVYDEKGHRIGFVR